MVRRSRRIATLENKSDSSNNDLNENSQLDKETEQQKWFKKHIKRKVCNRFVCGGDSSTVETCVCGAVKDDHVQEARDNGKKRLRRHWNDKEDTAVKQTDAFGKISFVGGRRNETSEFVRLSDETAPDLLVELLTDQWNLSKPNLLISVTGDKDNVKMTDKMKRIFSEGLMKAAASSSAWIVTEGLHFGAAKFVGKAARKSEKRIPIIGIAPWGCVAKRNTLTSTNDKSSVRYRADDDHSVMSSHEIEESELSPCRNEYPLDPNHSHFILVDNGTQNQPDSEVKLRESLEARMEHSPWLEVPRVLVLMGGGTGTLRTVELAVKEVPVIVLENSGGIADVIVHAHRNTERSDKGDLILSEETKKSVRKKLVNECGCDPGDIDNYVNMVEMCIAENDTLIITSFDDESVDDLEFDFFLLNTVLQANTTRRFELALVWNREDVVKKLTRDTCEQSELIDALMKGLQEDRDDIVSFLLDPDKLNLDEDQLGYLYNNALYLRDQPTFVLEKFSGFSPVKSVGTLLKELMDWSYQPEMSKKRSEFDSDFDLRSGDFEDPIRELFIWSVVMNYQKVVFLLWTRLKQPLAGALAAYLFKSALKAKLKVLEERKLCKQLEKVGNDFLFLAEQMLEASIGDDETEIEGVLHSKQAFLETTCLQLAIQSEDEAILSTDSVQIQFDRLWSGKLRSDQKWWKLVLCFCCPPLIPWLIRFNDIYDDGSYCCQFGCKIWWSRLKDFYTAPFIVFSVNCVSTVIFLLLFSYLLLVEHAPHVVGIIELILVVWVTDLTIDEFRQCIDECISRGFKSGIKAYFTSRLNIVDIIGISIFFLAFVMRFFPDTYETSRYILCCSLILFFCRLLHIFSASRRLGPMLMMIWEMVGDLSRWFLIITIFLLAYGVIRQAILHPNSRLEVMLFYSVLRASYWQMQGEIETFLGETENVTNTCILVDGVLKDCSWPQILVPICMGVYILFTNILMFNLLIAMFNHSFAKVQNDADRLWCKQRYSLIEEYTNKPPLPSPFIFFTVGYFLYSIIRPCKKAKCRSKTSDAEDGNSSIDSEMSFDSRSSSYFFDGEEVKKRAEECVNKLNGTKRKNPDSFVFGSEIHKDDRNAVQVNEAEGESVKQDKFEILQKENNAIKQDLAHISKQQDWIIEHLKKRGTMSTSRVKKNEVGDIGNSLDDTYVEHSGIRPENTRRWPDLHSLSSGGN